jgi:hypothetical protein
MNKQEKYYNYVVDDLVKNTEIDHDQETIKFPFYYNYILPLHPTPFLFSLSYLSTIFSKHVIERYGVHDEEMEIIWNQYREKILTIIGNG